MSRNPHGALHRTSQEWGSKARKEEDRARGMRRRAREDAIADQAGEGRLYRFQIQDVDRTPTEVTATILAATSLDALRAYMVDAYPGHPDPIATTSATNPTADLVARDWDGRPWIDVFGAMPV